MEHNRPEIWTPGRIQDNEFPEGYYISAELDWMAKDDEEYIPKSRIEECRLNRKLLAKEESNKVKKNTQQPSPLAKQKTPKVVKEVLLQKDNKSNYLLYKNVLIKTTKKHDCGLVSIVKRNQAEDEDEDCFLDYTEKVSQRR
jgi:hypothetical protein